MIYNLVWVLSVAAAYTNAFPSLDDVSGDNIPRSNDNQESPDLDIASRSTLEKRDACGRDDKIFANGWTLYNNMWGYDPSLGGNQKQCTILDKQSGQNLKFHTWYDWDRLKGNVKSFASAQLHHLPYQLHSIHDMGTRIDWDLNCKNNGKTGASVVYDLFIGPARNRAAARSSKMKPTNELMVWPGQFGGNSPISYRYDPYLPYRKGLKISGVNGLWDLYKGPNSGTIVHSFVPRDGQGHWENLKKWNGNLKGFVDWLVANGEIKGDYWLFQSNFGTEPAYGLGCEFRVNDLWMKVA